MITVLSRIICLHDIERRALLEPLDLLLIEGVLDRHSERCPFGRRHFELQVFARSEAVKPKDADLVCAVDLVVVSCNQSYRRSCTIM